jgi:CheY-like chemotaxis protein
MQLLIAHKDAAARASLARAITSGGGGGLEVIESGEGTEALELLLADDAPRLAVVDWDMPGLEGPELCRLVRDFHLGGPPYIVLLAAGRHPAIEEGLEAGANDCIRTPASAAEIGERVVAGRRFVEVPWERAARGASLAAVRSPDVDVEAWEQASRGVHLEAVHSPDVDVEALDSIELQAVLREA